MRLYGTTQLPAFVDNVTRAVARTFNRYWEHFDLRLHALEETKVSWEAATEELTRGGLRRIDDVILPVIGRVQSLAELGFLTATSASQRKLTVGQTAHFVIPAGPVRDLFTPTPWLALTRDATPEDWAIARLVTYSEEIGELSLAIHSVSGNPGPHADWVISAVAGSALAGMAHAQLAGSASAAAIAAAARSSENEDKTRADRLAVAEDQRLASVAASVAVGAAEEAARFDPTTFYTRDDVDEMVEGRLLDTGTVTFANLAPDVVGAIRAMPRRARTANIQITKDDNGALIDITAGTFVQTFASPADLGDGCFFYVRQGGSGDVTIPASDDRTNWIMYPGEVRLFQCDGMTLRSVVMRPFRRLYLASGDLVVPPGYRYLKALLLGGASGGSGGGWINSSGTGGNGATGAHGRIAETPFIDVAAIATTEAVVVGAGGAAGANGPTLASEGSNGGVGNASTFAGFSSFARAAGTGGSAAQGIATGAISSSIGSGMVVYAPSLAGGGGPQWNVPQANPDAERLFGIVRMRALGGETRNTAGPTSPAQPTAGDPGAVVIIGVL